MYGLGIVYMPVTQAQLGFLDALSDLHKLNMEAVVLVHMSKTCVFMSEPNAGYHYTLLPLTRDPNTHIGPLLMFAAAKLMVVSRHGQDNMGV